MLQYFSLIGPRLTLKISGDFLAMGPGWGARTAYIHEILIAILKMTRDDIKIIMISLYNRENAALKSQVTRVGLAHARPIMYNRVLHSQHTMNVPYLLDYTPASNKRPSPSSVLRRVFIS